MPDNENTESTSSDTEQSSDSNSQEDKQKQEEDKQKQEDEKDEAQWHPHMGKIMQIKPYKYFNSVNWDKSYEDPTGSGSVSMPYSSEDNDYCFSPSDVKYIYKGVCCKFKIRRSCEDQFKATGIEETGLDENGIFEREHYPTEEQKVDLETEEQENELTEQGNSGDNPTSNESEEEIRYSRSSYDDAIYGFISEVNYNQDGAELEIKDWGYALERDDIKLKMSGLHSTVFEEVIKSYGLIPDVDFTGLPNEHVDWTNMNGSSDDKSSGSTGGDASEIWKLQNTFVHPYRTGVYTVESTHDPELAWSKMGMDCEGYNVDCWTTTAWLYKALTDAGYTCRQINYPSSSANSGYHWVIQIQENGEWKVPVDKYKGGDSWLGCNEESPSGLKVYNG